MQGTKKSKLNNYERGEFCNRNSKNSSNRGKWTLRKPHKAKAPSKRIIMQAEHRFDHLCVLYYLVSLTKRRHEKNQTNLKKKKDVAKYWHTGF
jgi:hypothetical protein